MANSFCYAIRRPTGKHKSFSIQKQVLPSGSRTTVSLEAVDAINQQYQLGTISFDDAMRKMEGIRNDLYKERDKLTPRRDLFHSANVKILDKYWEDEYGDRDILHREDRYGDLRRAVDAIGRVSLVAASKQEMNAALDESLGSDANKQRRAVSRINQILRYLGRPFALRKKREDVKQLAYLTLAQLEIVLARFQNDPDLTLLYRVAFVTGCRAGELFAIRPTSIRQDGTVYVETQLTSDLEERHTKTRKSRRVWVLPEGRHWINMWAQLSMAQREGLRNRKHSTMLKAACRQAKLAQCRLHDLRHSYAVHCLSVLGAPIQLVAQSLGNSVTVCEKYYSGFVLTDPGIEFLEKLAFKKTS